MDFYARLLAILKARGFKNIPTFSRAHPQFSASSLYDYRDGKQPKEDRLDELARLLNFSRATWRYGSDEEFLAELEQADHTAPDPEPVADRVAGDDRGLFRSFPLHTFAHADGLIDGSLAIDVITRPTGASGELLKKRHAQRGDRSSKVEHVSIEGVPQGAELVRVEAPIRLRDEGDETIPKGHLLIVDRERKPEPGRLVLAVKNVDARVTEELPEVRIFRYHQAGRGWTLGAIDGTDATHGSGDGWEIVAAVLWWRSP